ncbi:Zn(2)-C6 fungal-type domain-containing protein [Mycena indigotica]|uniref:Zn(2)-C6 fungal-type domain-containing protein n=1 Tax=Mycena indigotica TaxID=2126181 RepID=A0A8H6SRN7_9AGAR|nr:Zn(2)-C6 fungal-type domain-containing protein [Mycena indigotica]KAF7303795.1 Zn(2)-C6 fungal-type domain-containing protein [Mycena indigotica]
MVTKESRRNNVTLLAGRKACAECYRLKLKCDRKVPCESCIRRGCDSLCPNGVLVSVGRGKRSVKSDAPILTEYISRMSERLLQLEAALEAHGATKETIVAHRLAEHDINLLSLPDKMGAMSVNADGDAVYFGSTGGPEALLALRRPATFPASADFPQMEPASEFGCFSSAKLSYTSKSAYSDAALPPTLEDLYSSLPCQERAQTLCQLYYQHGCWFVMGLRQDEVVELFAAIYSDNQVITQDHLACAFFILTIGVLLDLDLSPNDSTADFYFEMACEAMSLSHNSDTGDKPFQVSRIQALLLLAIVYSHGGKQFSTERAWAVVSMADSGAKTLGLHLATTYAKMERQKAYRLQALYWDIYSLESACCLTLGRPPTTLSTDITCPQPEDIPEEGQPFVKIQPGFCVARWRHTTEVVVPILEAFLPVNGKPSYKRLFEIDHQLRKYYVHSPFLSYPLPTPTTAKANTRGQNASAFMQKYLVPMFCKITLMHLHNAYFVQLLQDKPDDPINHPLLPSFMAAYRGAAEAIKEASDYVASCPELFSRWWIVWKDLFTAAVIVGNVATNYPTCRMVFNAIDVLLKAVELLEFGALSSQRAKDGLPLLRSLREKALSIHAQVSQSPSSYFVPGSGKPNCTVELEIFAGHTRVVANNGLIDRLEEEVASRRGKMAARGHLVGEAVVGLSWLSTPSTALSGLGTLEEASYESLPV